MFVSYFYTLLAYVLLLGILYCNVIAQQKYMKSKEIYIKNPKPSCNFDPSNLPSVNLENISVCLDQSKNEVPNYYVYTPPFSAFSFIVTDKIQTHYSNVCNNFCKNLNKNGNCLSKTNAYDSCLKLLEPPANCKNAASPLFTGSQNGIPYFALNIFKQGQGTVCPFKKN